MFSSIALSIILMMKMFPELPFARTCHRALVEAPLDWVERTNRQQLLYVAILVGMAFGGIELLLLLGSTDVLMLVAWDISLYADALIATWTLSAVARSKAIWQGLSQRYLRLLGRGARPRAVRRRRETTKEAANDSGEDRQAWGYARAA